MSQSEQDQSIFISVVIPAYNCEECVGRAIESVLVQTYKNFEIIVVDDGSSDKTAEVIKSYGDRVHYIYQENTGVSVARNSGIASANGDWIAFLDADDEFLPNKLELQAELIKRNPDLKWCAANYYRCLGSRRSACFDSKKITSALGGKDYFDNYFEDASRIGCISNTQTMVVRKEVFEELGGFEPGRTCLEDLDLWWRIAHQSPRFGFIAEPLTIMHLDWEEPAITKRRTSSKAGKDAREIVARHLKISKEIGDYPEFKAYASKEMQRRMEMMIFNGFGLDARETIAEFRDLFSWYVHLGTSVLTIFPSITCKLMHAIAYLAYILKIDRKVNRRWGKPKHNMKKI
ncbi:MAG: glycosyltransferase family 2 protein [Planctomycetota bacterium]|jgi:glycosyltransferase involved in cell wall biosynthesis